MTKEYLKYLKKLRKYRREEILDEYKTTKHRINHPIFGGEITALFYYEKVAFRLFQYKNKNLFTIETDGILYTLKWRRDV